MDKKSQTIASLGIMLGSDPEIFVANQEGRIVSGIDLIPGDKKDPYPITDKGHFIQVDNIAWEFNIPPCDTAESFSDNIKFVLDSLSTNAAEHGLVLSEKASEVIEESELQDPRALVFGCDPDFNAYTMSDTPMPDNTTKLRCVGGHVHIGYENPNVDDTIRIVKMFDLMVVLPSSLKDPDTRRRELYGKPGAFRFKNFGVECRALSNYWIHNEENRKWIFEQTTNAVILALQYPTEIDNLISEFNDTISDVILSNNPELINETIDKINITVNNLIAQSDLITA